jgi:ribosomal protein RSM22 (predicted rRNA methylase)
MIPFSKLNSCLLEDLSESEIVKCLKELSDGFTKSRHKIDELYRSRKHISSYASFYLPTNMYKMNFLLSQLDEEIIDGIKSTTIVEVGTGPGTYIFSLVELLQCEMCSFIGVDHSPLMLEQAKKVHESLYPCSDITWRADIPKVKGEKTFIFGNSLNEMGHYAALKIVNSNNAENIICIEPGTKSSFEEMSKFRDAMIKDGYEIAYPCLSNEKCPIVANGIDDWCHQVVRTKLDDSIERLSQLIKLDRKTMPAIFHVYTKKKAKREQGYRIVRLVKNIKHAFLWEVCSTQEGDNRLIRIEVMKKTLKKKDVKILEGISTGHMIDFEVTKKLDENHFRVNLSQQVLDKIKNLK